jgi:hypothetical protein
MWKLGIGDAYCQELFHSANREEQLPSDDLTSSHGEELDQRHQTITQKEDFAQQITYGIL